MTAPVLAVENLVKEFTSAGQRLRVLDGVSLSVAPGETVAVTGPSGSGKSTLLGLMAGLERPTSGRVLFEGEDVGAWDEERLAAWRRESIGFVFQNFRLVPSLTAMENAALPLELGGAPAAEAAERAGAILGELGLGGRLGHYPHQLSGGEQQRAAIARAYAHAPRLIFADEPTGSLDRETSRRVFDALLEANAKRGAALVVVTHDPAVAGRLARSVSLAAR